MPDITYDVGRVSFIMKGAWNLATNYEKLDAVTHDGSLYIAKQDVPGGTAITNTTYWVLAVEKGDTGDTGGVNSVNGQQGDIWFPDSRQLISDGYTTDTVPFLTKSNDSDSDRFELAKKLGNTVAVNQLQRTQTTAETATYSGVTVSNSANGVHLSGTATADIGNVYFDRSGYSQATTPGHTYLLFGCPSGGNGSYYLEPLMGAGADWCKGFPRDTGGGVIFTATKTNDTPDYIFGIRLYIVNGATNLNVDINCYLIDLTLWFGSNDRIPSDLLSHPENWGRYYAGSLAYNAGTLESADGSILTSIGRQIWDGEWESGDINVSNGQKRPDGSRFRNENFIAVSPNTTYYSKSTYPNTIICFYDRSQNWVSSALNVGYTSGGNTTFTTPSWCHYIMFYANGASYTGGITISLYYSGESGYNEDYDYTVLAEVDTGSEQLLAFDSKAPDGTITRKTLPRIDMGTLTFATADANGRTYASPIPGMKTGGVSGYGNFFKTNLFVGAEKPSMVQLSDGEMSVDISGYLQICKTAWANYSTEQLAAALSGIYLEAEAATPTTEQGTAFAPIVATVKNGVLSWTNTKGIPVGHESHFFENLRKRVEDRLPDPPSADGTYRLTCTITGGVKTYSWEA